MAKSFQQTITDFTTMSHDSSADNVTLGKSLVNTCIKKVLSSSDFTFNKDSNTYASVANQQYYDPPYNAAKMEYVNVYYGGVWYYLKEVRDGKSWRILNNVSVHSDVPQYWYISNRTHKFGIYPIPCSDDTEIQVGFTKKIRDLSVADYVTGTVTNTLNSTAIVGVLTVWTKGMIGRFIKITSADTIAGDYWFEITAVTDATHLIVREEIPAAIVGASYTIAELIPLPDGFEDIPLWYALSIYYQTKEMPALSLRWEKEYESGLDNLITSDSRSVVGILEKQGIVSGLDPNTNPWAIEITE